MIRPASLLFCLISALILSGADGGAQGINVITGNCNQVTQGITAEEGATVIIENDCFADDPAKSFRVRYFWLDSLSMSFVMAGYADAQMRQIVGSSPKVWRGALYPVLETVINRFGIRPTEESDYYYSGYRSRILSRDGTARQSFKSFMDLPESVRQQLRVYNGEQAILWPDIEAYRTLYQTDGWPGDYAMTYGAGEAVDGSMIADLHAAGQYVDDSVGICTQFYAFVDRGEFDTYWPRVRELAQRINSREMNPVIDPLTIERGKPGAPVSFAAYDAMGYFSQHNWPADYLVKYGGFGRNDCAQTSGFGIVAIPRKLFVLVAVVEATGRRLDIEGFTYVSDTAQGLRADIFPSREVREAYRFPGLSRGETIIVPLRIELRYDKDGYPFQYLRANSVSQRMHDAIANLPKPSVVLDNAFGLTPAIPKRRDAFRAPQFTDVTRTYYYGEARDLTHVLIGGKTYAVRPTPRVAMLSEAGFEGGSCPFLEVVEADGKPSMHGRVLVGASSKGRAKTDTVDLPQGARAVVISEREPEVSRLARIAVYDRASGARVALREDVTLLPQDSIRIALPQRGERRYRLEIEGYYELLTRPEHVAGVAVRGGPASAGQWPARQ